jgi:hypothetical protein
VSDGTIWSITLDSSVVMILEVSFTLTYDVYSTGITYDWLGFSAFLPRQTLLLLTKNLKVMKKNNLVN